MPLRDSAAGADAYRMIFRHAPDAVVVVGADGRIVDSNDRASQLFGWTVQELRGMTVEDLMPVDAAHVHGAHRRRYVAEPSPRLMGEVGSGDLRARRRDGTTFVVDISLSPIDVGASQLVAAAIRDVTADRQAAAALEASEARFRALFESSPQGMAVVDHRDRFVEVNPALCALVEQRAEQLLGTVLADLVAVPPPADPLPAAGEPVTSDAAITTGSGRQRWVEVHRAALPGDTAQADMRQSIVMFSDVTDRRARTALLAHRAGHDVLTDLVNRAGLMDHLGRMVARSHRDGLLVGLVFADLDRFKEVNDTHGHVVGDRVLAAAARRIQAASRAADVVARIGGDEFVAVLQTDTGDITEARDEVLLAAQRLLEACDGLPAEMPEADGVSVSIGVTIVGADDETDPDALLRRADAALYRAKAAGRGRVVADWDG